MAGRGDTQKRIIGPDMDITHLNDYHCTLPAFSSAAEDVTRRKMARFIVDGIFEDGVFSASCTTSEIDCTTTIPRITSGDIQFHLDIETTRHRFWRYHRWDVTLPRECAVGGEVVEELADVKARVQREWSSRRCRSKWTLRKTTSSRAAHQL